LLAVQWADFSSGSSAWRGSSISAWRRGHDRHALRLLRLPWSHGLAALAVWGCARRDRFSGAAARVAAVVFGPAFSATGSGRPRAPPDMPVLPGGRTSASASGTRCRSRFSSRRSSSAAVYGSTRGRRGRSTASGGGLSWPRRLPSRAVDRQPPRGSPAERARRRMGRRRMWLFVPWGYWIDRHRAIVTA